MSERVLGKVAKIIGEGKFSVANRAEILPSLLTRVAVIRETDIEVFDPDSGELLGRYEEVVCHAYISHFSEKFFDISISKPRNGPTTLADILSSAGSVALQRAVYNEGVRVGDIVVVAE